jgi:hypothetical protein
MLFVRYEQRPSDVASLTGVPQNGANAVATLDFKCALTSIMCINIGAKSRRIHLQGMLFARLPFMVKLAVGLAFMNSWVIFEDDVVDKIGLWRFMPFYRVGLPCVWDLTVAVAIVVWLVVWAKRGSTTHQA